MLSSVLRSARAIEVNIVIMRTFVRLREFLVTHEDLARKIAELERRFDGEFALVFDAIRQLAAEQLPDESERPRIGFIGEGGKA